jgi:hypothetical protein
LREGGGVGNVLQHLEAQAHIKALRELIGEKIRLNSLDFLRGVGKVAVN